MPFIRIQTCGFPLNAAAVATLQAQTTHLMASLLGKRADLTVVAIGSDPAGTWSANGSATARAANLQAFITAGTNTDAEKAAFLAAARCMMEEVLGESTAPMYVVLSEVAASDWGYDGLSQAQRRCDAH